MYNEKPSNTEHDKFYTWPVVNATNNKGLDKVVEKLELIYKSIDWPFKDPVQEVSLFQSGKSRADLWQLAGLVSLEETLERGNRACDLDYHARQQVCVFLFVCVEYCRERSVREKKRQAYNKEEKQMWRL